MFQAEPWLVCVVLIAINSIMIQFTAATTEKIASAVQPRIVGGWHARKSGWPWLVAIKEQGELVCGGALIDTDIVLTAAHCLENGIRVLSVDAAVYNLQRQAERGTIQRFRVSKAAIFPKYNPMTMDSDIAILKLNRSVHLGHRVAKISLPPRAITFAPRKLCWIAGWGQLTGNDDSAPWVSILRHTVVQIIDSKLCNNSAHFNGFLSKNMFCAGFPGIVDACLGDSGGPLICDYKGKWVLYGIISFGVGCAQPSFPGVYTKLTNYLKWIKEKMKSL